MMKFFIFLSLLMLCFSFGVSAPAFAARDSLLDSAPTHKFSASKLSRWEDILSTHVSDIYNSRNPNIDTWNAFIETLEGEPKLRQILKVNAWFKQFPYKQDNWVYNQDDYWATPTEFLTYGGDCEDYAIIKYVTLRKLGFSPSDMKIAIVYDIYSGTDHAFLTVKHQGAEFVLDNREKVAVSRYMKNRYKPHYAFNEKDMWTYDSPVIVQKMRKASDGAVLPGNR